MRPLTAHQRKPLRCGQTCWAVDHDGDVVECRFRWRSALWHRRASLVRLDTSTFLTIARNRVFHCREDAMNFLGAKRA